MRISDWSSDVCSSDLLVGTLPPGTTGPGPYTRAQMCSQSRILAGECISENQAAFGYSPFGKREAGVSNTAWPNNILVSGGESFSITGRLRSEEHTSELQSLMRISYAVFCLKKKNKQYQLSKSEH